MLHLLLFAFILRDKAIFNLMIIEYAISTQFILIVYFAIKRYPNFGSTVTLQKAAESVSYSCRMSQRWQPTTGEIGSSGMLTTNQKKERRRKPGH